jgi:ABC-type sugar transport system ATPase subunit
MGDDIPALELSPPPLLLGVIAPRPRHLLMDEPMTHLDLDLKQGLLAFIREFTADSGVTLLSVTHDPGEADSLGIPKAHFRDGEVFM